MPTPTFFNLPAEKRERILNLAIEEFAENDYQNASITRLVERAGIAKGSFYQYFADKEDLYRYLLELAAQEKRKLLSAMPPDPEMGIFAYLRWLARESVRFELAYPYLSRVGYRALTDNTYPPDFIARMKEQSLAFFRQLVAQGKAQGDIAPEIDDDLAAFIFNTIFTELGQYMLRRLPQRPGEDAVTGRELRAFFDSGDGRRLYEQTLAILECGMGYSPFGETR